MLITDEERLNLQLLYEPFRVLTDLVDAQEAFDDVGRAARRAVLVPLLRSLTQAQWQLFRGYMDETFIQMLVIEKVAYYEGINAAVDYVNEREP